MTNLPSMTSGLPDMGASLLRVVGALAVVIALFLVGVWLFRNWQRLSMRRGAAPKLSVLEVQSLGQRQAIYVVGYEQQRLLLASSSSGVTLLSHLPSADEEPVAAAPKLSFAQAFQQVLARKS
ncbi:MAG TPA: flagellar biosynthetic protein FliO [Candidatus Cybelea sp.]|nr:flagellar biosynthetic protein FliO [Candidatus Cybelea sp.]